MAHTAPGTRLTRKTPQDDAYDDIRVIGFSPISFSSGRDSGEWTGSQSKIVTVTPAEFGSNIDLPVGQIEEEYDVVSIPDERPHSIPEPPKDATTPLNELPSPEDQFKSQEKGDKSPERQETPLASPKKPGRPKKYSNPDEPQP